MIVATVQIILKRDRVNICRPFATEETVSSMGAVRKRVSPRIAKRTTMAESAQAVS